MTKNDIHKIVHYVYHTKYRISVSQRDEISAMEKTTDWGKQWRRQKACCSSHQATYSRRLNFVLFSSARNCSVSLKRLLMGWRLRSKCKAFRLCWEKEKLLRSIRVVSQMNKTTSFFFIPHRRNLYFMCLHKHRRMRYFKTRKNIRKRRLTAMGAADSLVSDRKKI